MRVIESPTQFFCHGQRLYGILHQPVGDCRRGILMVSGEQDYRIGPHRMWVLLARFWARLGLSVMRFDSRGLGDSEGAVTPLIEVCDDIAAARDCFLRLRPNLEKIVLWSFCGVVPPTLNYFLQTPSVGGIIIVNPWMPKEEAHSSDTGGDVLEDLGRRATDPAVPALHDQDHRLRASHGRVLIILSGDDFSLTTFKMRFISSLHGRMILSSDQVSRYDLPQADHLFTKRACLERLGAQAYEWVKAL